MRIFHKYKLSYYVTVTVSFFYKVDDLGTVHHNNTDHRHINKHTAILEIDSTGTSYTVALIYTSKTESKSVDTNSA